jgi:hypothetical protein
MNKLKTNSEENYQLFLDTWKLLHSNLRMFDYYIKQPHLSLSEKKLLKAFYFYKKNKKESCLTLLASPIPNEPFLEAVRYYLIGLTYNQFCHYIYAAENLQKSIDIFQSIENQSFIFNPLCLLVMVAGNRRDLKTMAKYLDQIQSIDLSEQTRHMQLQLEYAQLFYFVLNDQIDKARMIFDKAERRSWPEYQVFKPYYLVQIFMMQVKLELFEDCYKTLDKYKACPAQGVKANYQFMKTLLDHLQFSKPLYVYANDFSEFPELFQQLEVIKNLSLGNMTEARKYWHLLQRHNPQLYSENFKFTGDKCLFSISLERYQHYFSPLKKLEEINSSQLSKIELLHHLLSSSLRPLTQEELIESIYREHVDEKAKARLRKLISNYSKKYSAEIRSQQSTYQLIRKAS